MTAPSATPFNAEMLSRDITGWDVPLSDEGAWSVPVESEAAAPCVGIGWYRKHVDSSVFSLPAAASNGPVFADDSNRLLLAGTDHVHVSLNDLPLQPVLSGPKILQKKGCFSELTH